MENSVFFFTMIALGAACIGAASGLFAFDAIAAGAILWAWIMHEFEGEEQ